MFDFSKVDSNKVYSVLNIVGTVGGIAFGALTTYVAPKIQKREINEAVAKEVERQLSLK